MQAPEGQEARPRFGEALGILNLGGPLVGGEETLELTARGLSGRGRERWEAGAGQRPRV